MTTLPTAPSNALFIAERVLDRFTLAVHTWNTASGGPNFMTADAELRAAREELRALLNEGMRWAPRSGEKYVRVSDEFVAELRASPSAPVTMQISDEPDGTLMFVCKRYEPGLDT